MTWQVSRRSGGFSLLEMLAVLTILALATAISLPVIGALSRSSRAEGAAGDIANLVNRRAAAARAGGGPCEIALAGPSTVAVVVESEAEEEAAAAEGNTVLGRSLLSRAPASAAATEDAGQAVEALGFDGVTLDALHVRDALTGEARESLRVAPDGTCDDALFAVTGGGATTWVSVRGAAGRARVYDRLPPCLAERFEVSGNGTAQRQ